MGRVHGNGYSLGNTGQEYAKLIHILGSASGAARYVSCENQGLTVIFSAPEQSGLVLPALFWVHSLR